MAWRRARTTRRLGYRCPLDLSAFRNQRRHLLTYRTCTACRHRCRNPENQMSSYVAPNGRLYKRERSHGKWIALTIVSISVIGSAILGLPAITAAFMYVGL